jgi:hypothetical protein
MKTKTGLTFLFILVSLASYSHATLSSGLDTLFKGTFDFSSPGSAQQVDLQYVKQAKGNSEILTDYSGITETTDSVLANVTQAPVAGYNFIVDLTVDNKNRVFCLKTTEGNYAKFKLIGYYQTKRIIIEWVYQNDGTTDFKSNPVSRSYNEINWGRLKTIGQTSKPVR